MEVFLYRKNEYPEGEILIDPTIEQTTDAWAKGLNPEAGKALLRLARSGKLNRTELEVVDQAWDQLGQETGAPVKLADEYDPAKLPSEVGVVSRFSFKG